MKKLKIILKDMKDIEKLCAASVEAPFEVDILSGNYIIDAKSIMGIFSLDRSQPLTLAVHAEDERTNEFLSQISGLVVS